MKAVTHAVESCRVLLSVTSSLFYSLCSTAA